MSLRSEPTDLGALLSAAFANLRQARVPFVATPAASRLEHDLFPFAGDEDGTVAGAITHLEGEGLRGRAVPVALRREHDSPLRYFLDGVQRTLPLGWCGMNAVALVVVVAGVVERRPQDRIFRAVPGHVETEAAVIIASAPADDFTAAVYAAFAAAGLAAHSANERAEPPLRAGDYLALQGAIRLAVGRVRSTFEYRLSEIWAAKQRDPGAWLVVDGTLVNGAQPRTLGVIKRHSRFDFTNAEMTAILRLPVGHRTTAFQRVVGKLDRPLSWYLRLHDATGADPLFGLTRIEAPYDTDMADVDILSRHLLAERTPRATADDRWPTLLYPIHITERILKVKLARALLGVPAALRRHLREVA